MKEKIKNWVHDFLIVAFCILFGFIVGKYNGIKSTTTKIRTEARKIECADSINTQCLKNLLDKSKVKFSHIVLAQAKLESKLFTSPIAVTNKNIFGMKIAATRFTFATNGHDYGNYAMYESYADCVLDYKAWQMQCAYLINDEDHYYELLGRIYAQDPQYVKKLKILVANNDVNYVH
jgi:flagellum-specific peptidoglycan hydrolase FlgJ